MFQKFFINFWIWWYFFQVKEIGNSIRRTWFYILGYLNIVPMATNLFVPLYQDRSMAGRMMSAMIRIVWVIFGTVALIIITIPMIVIFLISFILPILPIIMIFSVVL